VRAVGCSSCSDGVNGISAPLVLFSHLSHATYGDHGDVHSAVCTKAGPEFQEDATRIKELTKERQKKNIKNKGKPPPSPPQSHSPQRP